MMRNKKGFVYVKTNSNTSSMHGSRPSLSPSSSVKSRASRTDLDNAFGSDYTSEWPECGGSMCTGECDIGVMPDADEPGEETPAAPAQPLGDKRPRHWRGKTRFACSDPCCHPDATASTGSGQVGTADDDCPGAEHDQHATRQLPKSKRVSSDRFTRSIRRAIWRPALDLHRLSR